MSLLVNINALRRLVCEYRIQKTDANKISTHLNAVDIVLGLVDLAIRDKRKISKEEETWFRADLYLSYVFDNSEWEEISNQYKIIVAETKKLNYFRD